MSDKKKMIEDDEIKKRYENSINSGHHIPTVDEETLDEDEDFQKWLDSERKETDMSGAEPWCYFCKYRKENVTCGCDPEIRAKEAICVEAYHEMQKKLK